MGDKLHIERGRRFHAYLTDKSENKVVDGDISIQSKSEANKENQVMHKDRRNPTRIQAVMKHIPLIICKITT